MEEETKVFCLWFGAILGCTVDVLLLALWLIDMPGIALLPYAKLWFTISISIALAGTFMIVKSLGNDPATATAGKMFFLTGSPIGWLWGGFACARYVCSLMGFVRSLLSKMVP